MAGRKDDEWPGWEAGETGKEPKTVAPEPKKVVETGGTEPRSGEEPAPEPKKVTEAGGTEPRRTAAALEPEVEKPKDDTSPRVVLRCHRDGGEIVDVETTEDAFANEGVAVPMYTARVQSVPSDEGEK